MKGAKGFSATGWILLALAVLALAASVTVGALRAHGPGEFNQWVGWATVAAVPLAAVGVLLLLGDKIRGSFSGPRTSVDAGEEVSSAPESGGPAQAKDTLPWRNATFTGRLDALEALGKRLAMGPVALRGLGGMGKSQLALEYGHRTRQSRRYQIAGWVRADSAATIAEDLAALAPLLALPVEGNVGEIAAQVVGALGVRRDWLVVFDNAQRPADLVGMLPGGGGHVLITSRRRVWSGIATQVDLGEFSRAESVRFLCQRSGRDEPEDAGELADELGDLPLALAQAAAYIDARSTTVRRYLELYRDPDLARTLRDAGLDSAEYPASVARTWLLSFKQLSEVHPAAVELLRLCAFLDADDIDLDLLSAGKAEADDLARVLGNQLDRTEAVGSLAQTSLVTVLAEGHLRVHRLVQAVTRDQLDDNQVAEWAGLALKVVAAILPPEPADYRSWAAYAKLAPHIGAVAAQATGYSILTDKIRILHNLGIYFTASGQPRAACTTSERALSIAEAVYGPDHPEVAKRFGNLGAAQLELGELKNAGISIERALIGLQEAYGPHDPEVGKALGNLSRVQFRLRELSDARINIERALAIFEAANGPDHPEVAKSFVNLGHVQRDLGQLKDARTSFEHGLTIYEAAHGPHHPAVAGALINLGEIHLELWKLRDAHASIVRAVPILKTAHELDRRELAVSAGSRARAVFKRRKIAGFIFFVLFIYAVARAEWHAVDGGTESREKSRHSDPGVGRQSGGL